MRRSGRYTALLVLLLAALLIPGHGDARERGRSFRVPQDLLRQLPLPDSTQAKPGQDSTQVVPDRDSLRKLALYRSLDSIFWGQLDLETLPSLDSMVTAYMDSLSQFLPDTHDIKRAMRKIRKEERDSLRAAKPRVPICPLRRRQDLYGRPSEPDTGSHKRGLSHRRRPGRFALRPAGAVLREP